jgi:aspartyl/asparaginyl beta-hydroxylase (cupin superfamily)
MSDKTGLIITIVLEMVLMFVVEMSGPYGLFRVINHYFDEICENHIFIEESMYPQLKTLHSNFNVIEKECNMLLNSLNVIPDAQHIDPSLSKVVSNHDLKFYMLMILGHHIQPNIERCKQTYAFVSNIEERINVYVLLLEPKKSIKPHASVFKGLFRYVLPTNVCEGDNCYIQCDDSKKLFKKKNGILYDARNIHTIVNDTTKYLVMLVIDLVRPLEGFAKGINRLTLSLASKHEMIEHAIHHATIDA